MRVLYISQDGTAPSGITTYGYRVIEAWPDARMLLLNATEPSPTCPADIRLRVTCVSAQESHAVSTVAKHLEAAVRAMGPGLVTVLPNTGDTPWSAVVHLLRHASPELARCVRVLGVVHSDVETQYVNALRHVRLAGAWVGVSRQCADVLRTRLQSLGIEAHELPYPIAGSAIPPTVNVVGPLRLAYVGRIEEPQKRVSRLVSLFDALHARNLAFTASIAGDGPAMGSLAAAMGRAHWADRVTLLGAVDGPTRDRILAESDVFLLTSAFEGLPIALLEAMAAGVCPVVMEIASGVSETVVPWVTGVSVPQGDVLAMAAALERLDHDRSLLADLRMAAAERVRSMFSPEPHFTRLGALVKQCEAQPPPDPSGLAHDPTARLVCKLVDTVAGSAERVAIYGAGMFGRKLVDGCLDGGVLVDGWFDSDPARAGAMYRGLVCRGPHEMVHSAATIYLVGSVEFAGEIEARIATAFERAANIPRPRIVSVRDLSSA